MRLSILYRGPLASCDYDCPYCPFAKRRDTPAQLRADRAALERFTRWVAAGTGDQIGYVHLEPLGLYETFAGGVLERIPADPLWGTPPAGAAGVGQ